MNRKGLTPLMATIMLLAFALVIGTITMNWGKGYVERLTEEQAVGPSESIVINPNALNDPLKVLMVNYIEGKITKEEYDQKVREFS